MNSEIKPSIELTRAIESLRVKNRLFTEEAMAKPLKIESEPAYKKSIINALGNEDIYKKLVFMAANQIRSGNVRSTQNLLRHAAFIKNRQKNTGTTA